MGRDCLVGGRCGVSDGCVAEPETLMQTKLPDDYDAWEVPRKIQPGCPHQLGCKCEPPFWLRSPTQAEMSHFHPEQRHAVDRA